MCQVSVKADDEMEAQTLFLLLISINKRNNAKNESV